MACHFGKCILVYFICYCNFRGTKASYFFHALDDVRPAMAQWLALVAEYDKAGCAGGGSVSGGRGVAREDWEWWGWLGSGILCIS